MSEWTLERPFPRGPLLLSAGIVLLSLVLATGTSLTGVGAQRTLLPAAVESRDLMFADRADGAILVTDITQPTAAPVVLMPGTSGFVRVATRGLARERNLLGIGPEAPFRLIRDAEDQLWLFDSQTDRKIQVDAFGRGNRDAFAQLLQSFRKATP